MKVFSTLNLTKTLPLALGLLIAILIFSSGAAVAKTIVCINLTDAEGIGQSVGTITVEDTDHGLLLTPTLANVTPGIHGFHIHQNPDCGPGEKNGTVTPGLAAGGHFDPFNAERQAGPYGNGGVAR